MRWMYLVDRRLTRESQYSRQQSGSRLLPLRRPSRYWQGLETDWAWSLKLSRNGWQGLNKEVPWVDGPRDERAEIGQNYRHELVQVTRQPCSSFAA